MNLKLKKLTQNYIIIKVDSAGDVIHVLSRRVEMFPNDSSLVSGVFVDTQICVKSVAACSGEPKL